MVEKILEEDTKQDYRNVLEMPPMSSMPPIHRMMVVQADLREAGCVKRVEGIVDEAINNVELQDDYWLDWCKVLASHRTLKLENTKAANELLRSTSFGGYRYFEKKS